MKPIMDFRSCFCENTEPNEVYFSDKYKYDSYFYNRRFQESKWLYITKDMTICKSNLDKDDLLKLDLKHVTNIDGLWYDSNEIENYTLQN